MSFVTAVYKISTILPQEERYRLFDQLRRASVSISSNIAEGSRRSTDKDFKSFLHNSLGSLSEVETQLLICKNLQFISDKDLKPLQKQADELSRMLMSFIKKLS